MGAVISEQGLIRTALLNSTLTEELRDAEIEVLARLVELRHYRAGEVIEEPGENNYADNLGDTLMMLGSGEVEVTFETRGETATLKLSEPGELSAILGFVGGDVSCVSIGVKALTDCSLLLINRKRFEGLLNGHPAVAYYVMRGLVRHVHGIVRRLNVQTMEMRNYLYASRHVPHAHA
jgi:CRP-like cAMP-binding protein